MKRAFPILVFLAFVLSACDRSFSDVGEASIEVLSPDVTVALTESILNLELRVTAVRTVTSVRTGGIDFSNAANSDVWQASFTLDKGLNRFVIESTVDDGPVGLDTVDVFHLTHSFESLTANNTLIFKTGGHTLTRLNSDDLLLVGGTAQPGAPAAFDAYVWLNNSIRFTPVSSFPISPRVGHSDTLLPDGRVLFLGGASLGDISTVDQLVEAVEVFDPQTQLFTPIEFVGHPIRRMYHSAILRPVGSDVFVVLLGGRGDTRYTPSPLLDIRQDLRTFQLRNDTLFALSPAVGPFVEFMAGHTQTALSPTSDRYLISGMSFGETLAATSLVMDYSGVGGIEIIKTTVSNTPKLRHASVRLAPGVVGLFNGRGEDIGDVYSGGELFVEEANSYFSFPADLAAQMTPSFGHTATLMPDGRVLIAGGFDAAGLSLSTMEFVSLEIQ